MFPLAFRVASFQIRFEVAMAEHPVANEFPMVVFLNVDNSIRETKNWSELWRLCFVKLPYLYSLRKYLN